ncbi:hypothetical protein [Epilithonimonas vandammei]|jgi:hypothetical protein|uniref:Uncharacterized protein n=1 Tax=Epilithonimonas vandammei TaxID=2487072 RepID=A0A3G8ZG07_9FLAO|nr:hypothetical protein [Epilithonimonas vandammei]AZI38910.1 hypothetical protein EIB74_02570 [Epilithonimonas vandammei]AZI55765.1 hypothetical protein EIB75_11085 [Epilithonimonas vandammei]
MNRNLEIIFAGLFGTTAVLSAILVRKYLKDKIYSSDYSDHHLLFSSPINKNYASSHQGVELEAFL